jgi:phosphate/phosphite/phosphonate ABC transporter binding protein
MLVGAVLLGACAQAPAAEATEEPAEATEAPAEATEPPMDELPDLGGREITVAVENAYLPFNFISLETGEPGGWDYDFLAEACARLNCVPVYVEFGWDTMITAVSEGQFDMAADGITITEERAEVVDFSDGYVSIEQRMLVRIDETRFANAEEFAADSSLVFGEQVGTTNYDKAVELVGEERVVAFDDFGLTVQSLIAGDVDAVIIDEVAGQGYVGANSESVMLIGESLSSDALGFIFPKGSDLVAPFNAVIAQMKADGSLAAINTKWFGPDFDVTYDDIDCGAYCEAEGPALGTEENPIVWALVPSQDAEAVLAGAESIAAVIFEQTGLVVTPVVTTDFSAAVEAMCNGEAHMGALNTFNYVLAHARECADVAVASVRFGSTFYSGQILAHKDSGITSIADLAGRTFCRPDPTSTSGWIIPMITMQANGINPETDLAEIVDAGGHDGVVIAIYNGDCEAGSTFVDARGNVEEDFPDVKDVVVVIQESAPIPNDNISFAPGVDAATRDAIIAVLLDLASTEDGLAILNTVYSWSGMQVVGDDFYDGFRQQLEAAGMTIEDLIGE